MTNKQKIATAKIVESRGSIPISEAMRAAGYDETTVKNPKNLTESKGYKAFITMLPDDAKVAAVLDEGLIATKRDQYSGEYNIDFGERRQTAKLITELKGYLKQDINVNQQFNSESMSLEFTTKEASS